MNRGILFVSFGTAYNDSGEKISREITEKIRQKYPDDRVYRAVSSERIRKKLHDRNVEVMGIRESLDKMKAEKIENVWIQSSYFIHGKEQQELKGMAQEYQKEFKELKVEQPLLSSEKDAREITDSIQEAYSFRKDEAVLFMGHGSKTYGNQAYEILLEEWKHRKWKDCFLGTMEGKTLDFSAVRKQIKESGKKKICMVPFLWTSGKHTFYDMILGENSWKAILEKEGYQIRYYFNGLGELENVQEIVLRHLSEASE